MSTAPRFSPLPHGCEACLCPQSLVPGTGLGECIIAGDGAGGVMIVRADPRIAVSWQLLCDWHDGAPPGITFECQGENSMAGDIIRIESDEGRVVYVITGVIDPGNRVWEARWPD